MRRSIDGKHFDFSETAETDHRSCVPLREAMILLRIASGTPAPDDIVVRFNFE